jgi:capsular polysaccharide biosynthesis protein/Mrp family chromosome partitioning ATPase
VISASLRTNARLVLFAMAVLAVASLAHATRHPEYTASSQLLLGPSASHAELRPINQEKFDRQTATFELSVEAEAAILPSEVVAQRVARALKLTIPPDQLADSITASPLSEAVVEVQASAPDPRLAAQLANGFADQYLIYRSQITRQAVAGLMRAFDARSAEVRAEIERLDTAQDSASTAVPIPADNTDGQASSSERERLLAVLQSLDLEATRLKAVGNAHAAGGAVISRAQATAQGSPANEAVKLGLVVGGALGGALALLRRHALPAANSSAEVQAATGMPVLARASMEGSEPHAASSRATPSGALFARGLGTTLHSVLVVAADLDEDVTTVAADLAVACAAAGLPTVALSASGTRPSELQDRDGPDSLIGSLVSVGANLMILPEAISAGRAREMVAAARQFSVVLIQGPPLFESGAAITIGESCDIVLLVTSASPTDRRALEEAGRALASLNRPLQGVVVIDPPRLGRST